MAHYDYNHFQVGSRYVRAYRNCGELLVVEVKFIVNKNGVKMKQVNFQRTEGGDPHGSMLIDGSGELFFVHKQGTLCCGGKQNGAPRWQWYEYIRLSSSAPVEVVMDAEEVDKKLI